MKKFTTYIINLPELAFPLILIICFGLSYTSVFYKLGMRWSSPDTNFAYLILPLCFYLCWAMRTRFHFGQFSWSPWGFLPISLSIATMVLAELCSVETFLYIGIWGCLVGLAVLLYGKRVKTLAFPMLILVFIVPLPPLLNELLTFRLKIISSILSTEMLRAVGISVFREGNILDLAFGKLQVVDACSGLHSFMSMILVSLVIARFLVHTWWQRAILLALVLPFSVILNGFRIFVTGLLTVKGYSKLAESFFHDFSGWVIFLLALVLLISSAFLLNKLGLHRVKKLTPDPGATYVNRLLPCYLTTLSCILFIIGAQIIEIIPTAHAMPPRASFESFPMKIDDWVGERHDFSEKTLGLLGADDYVSAIYRKSGFNNRIYLLIPFYEYQGTRRTAHAPRACLLGSGWILIDRHERQVTLGPDKEVNISTMLLKKENGRMLLAYYFFLQRGRVLTNPWLNKFYLAYDALKRRRTDGAVVRVEMTLGENQPLKQGYEILDNFFSFLWPILPAHIPL